MDFINIIADRLFKKKDKEFSYSPVHCGAEFCVFLISTIINCGWGAWSFILYKWDVLNVGKCDIHLIQLFCLIIGIILCVSVLLKVIPLISILVKCLATRNQDLKTCNKLYSHLYNCYVGLSMLLGVGQLVILILAAVHFWNGSCTQITDYNLFNAFFIVNFVLIGLSVLIGFIIGCCCVCCVCCLSLGVVGSMGINAIAKDQEPLLQNARNYQ